MRTRPDDVSDEAVAEVLRRQWGMQAHAIAYAPVGFGSHHWRVATPSDRWFVTVDDLDARLANRTDSRSAARERLEAALSTAVSLQAGGCEFVVAAIPSSSGRIVASVGDRYALAVYPNVEGVTGSFGPFGDRAERLAVVDLLVRLHATDIAVPARSAELEIPGRDRLRDAIAELSHPWHAGPFAEPARQLLAEHQGSLQRALAAYDELVATVRAKGAPLVISHGEPHRGNVIVTRDGPVLVDWDTTRLARPERDLWSLIGEDPEVRRHYERAARRKLDDDALRMHRLWWDLCEVSLFVDDVRRPHRDTDDTRIAWRSLQRHLDPARWADVI